jgi:hypothetical protein
MEIASPPATYPAPQASAAAEDLGIYAKTFVIQRSEATKDLP